LALVTYVPRMSRDYDPRAVIVKQIEEVARSRGWAVQSDAQGIDRMHVIAEMLGLRVTGPDVLLGVYDRSGQYTSGKVLVPPAYLEDKVQGKVAMILAMGPLCRGPEYEEWFGGPANTPHIGEWWTTSIRDGLTYMCGAGLVLKEVEWKYLRMKTDEPDIII
jgi:hypothetical protein